jgi:LytS/YehU family sensor histidine kinase
VVQPLLENAVKHGVAMMAEGGEVGVSGNLVREADRHWLRITVRNPFDPDAPSAGRNGLGLRNIRERLESRYGSAARLDIQVEESLYQVTLTIPAKGPRL